MKKKVLTLTTIFIVMSSCFMYTNNQNSQAWWGSHHTKYLTDDAIYLLQTEWSDVYEGQTYDGPWDHLKDCYDELKPSTSGNRNKNYWALQNGSLFADTDGWNSQHHWDPIEEYAMELPIDHPFDGAPWRTELYFNLAVELYNTPENDPIPQSVIDALYLNLVDVYAEELLFLELERTGDNGEKIYTNNKERAYCLLGMALHILQDVCNPLHATADLMRARISPEYMGDANHNDIERQFYYFHKDDYDYYEDKINGEYSDLSNLKQDWEGNYNIRGWIHQAALVSYNQYDDLIEACTNSPWLFGDLAEIIVEHTISISAGFLFYFWQIVNNIDFDEDGLSVEEENSFGTDIELADSDFDGLIDGEEVNLFGTNPINSDTDADGLSDGWEIILSETDPLDEDSDNDQLLDGLEVLFYNTDPINPDSDNDDYSDYEEVIVYSTNPLDYYDNPARLWIPESVIGFTGIPNQVSKISFVWYHPANHQPGWYYQIWRKPKYSGSFEIVSTTNIYGTTFQDYPPSLYTTYTYRIACFNLNNQQGPYSSWDGRVKSQGGGQGGG